MLAGATVSQAGRIGISRLSPATKLRWFDGERFRNRDVTAKAPAKKPAARRADAELGLDFKSPNNELEFKPSPARLAKKVAPSIMITDAEEKAAEAQVGQQAPSEYRWMAEKKSGGRTKQRSGQEDGSSAKLSGRAGRRCRSIWDRVCPARAQEY